jgi:hypothetical protein
MSDDSPKPLMGIEELRARTDALEQQLRDVNEASRASLVRAELKAEALRAGMVDLDGLKLFDSTALKVSDTGDVMGAADLMAKMKREKPWLFGSASSSSPAAPPPAAPMRNKRATEMTAEEYRIARAELLRRR